MRLKLALFSLLFLAAQNLSANAIGEHIVITNLAIDTYQRCTGRAVPEILREVLVHSDVDEDINLIRKWVSYSHYYNPRKQVKMWRNTSDVRVLNLQNDIENGTRNDGYLQNSYERLGHLIHHFQDSTVPAHVVPIKHWLRDQYESYYRYHETRTEPLDCGFAFQENLETPMEILKNTAEATLKNMEEKWNVFFEGKPASISWNLFWQPSPGEGFGSYGPFGNSFGNQKVTLNGVSFDVPESAYKGFHEIQTELAVKASVQALLWFDTLLK